MCNYITDSSTAVVVIVSDSTIIGTSIITTREVLRVSCVRNHVRHTFAMSTALLTVCFSHVPR